ncbi:UDP-N-acetylmuramoyl-tripeptide--D-alanyl-D-alanine ligase [Listeria sp. ILCC797]|uniref:UDP-N-acetylmuramoyl-tripeptide--D-alanyl-D- alanine ligase n=1 Tax=Listeria sp. ILCC797 TaxID=1918333 RepID=UPI000B58A5BF|nr:UDP-N-acetylmuramoyl-tripeptide--D-alanyl-D-alanine ligase [Listeria sp. ILCC797]
MKKTIGQIAKLIAVENDAAFDDTLITGICFDTRQIKKGDLFIPFVGDTRDGHTFVKQAIELGAAAAFWQKDVPHPPTDFPIMIVDDTLLALQELAKAYLTEVKPTVLAITGSNGKTTTKDIANAIFSSKYRVHATKGNFNNHIGLPYTILTMPEETEVAILEMGMNHRHEIEKLSLIAQPDVAIITNIGEAHIEYLGSRDEIAKAKLEITAGLKENGMLIYPNEEVLIDKYLNAAEAFKTATFGREKTATIYPLTIDTKPDGTSFTTNFASDTPIFVPIIGEHNVFNTMAVILAAKTLAISSEEVQAALSTMERSKSRLEWLAAPNGTKILNDAYNSSPTALNAVLNTFMHMDSEGKPKKILVADMLELGDDSERFHRESGAILQGSIDAVFAYGDAMSAFCEAAAKQIGQEKIHYFKTKEALQEAVLENLDGSEWLLVKGSYGMGLKDIVEKLMIG